MNEATGHLEVEALVVIDADNVRLTLRSDKGVASYNFEVTARGLKTHDGTVFTVVDYERRFMDDFEDDDLRRTVVGIARRACDGEEMEMPMVLISPER